MSLLTAEYRETVATIVDTECTTCHKAPTAKDGEPSRQNITATLDALALVVDDAGYQGTRFAEALKQQCAHCLAGGRQLPILENRFSCGIRQSSWQIKPRSGATR